MTAKAKKRSSGARFALGMLIYALIFIVLIVVALRLLWSFLYDYEMSRPVRFIDAYMDSVDDDTYARLNDAFLDSLNPDVNTKEEYLKVILDNAGTLHYSKKSTESSENRIVYVLSNDERDIGSVVIAKDEDPRLGFSPWRVESESMDFSWLKSSCSITVPDHWTVFCNNTALDESYITGSGIRYDFLEEFYDKPELHVPNLAEYQVDNYIGEAVLTVQNNFGEIVEMPEINDENMGVFADNCTEDEKQTIEAYLNKFLPLYVTFNSNYNRNEYGNYYALSPYLLSDSDIDRRLYGMLEGLYYAHSKGDSVRDTEIHRMMNFGGGYYMVDYTYKVDTIGNNGLYTSTINAKLLMLKTDNGLKATEIFFYE